MSLFSFLKKEKKHECRCGGNCCHNENKVCGEDSIYNRGCDGEPAYKRILEMQVNAARDNALLPMYSHYGDAGLDVYASSFIEYYNSDNSRHDLSDKNLEEFILYPMQRLLIGTGIKAETPKPIFFLGFIRSGLSTKHGIMLVNGAGVIDNPYRGEICLQVINMSSEPYKFVIGERFAQIVPFEQVEVKPRFTDKAINNTDRGEGGFGHTGSF